MNIITCKRLAKSSSASCWRTCCVASCDLGVRRAEAEVNSVAWEVILSQLTFLGLESLPKM